MKVLSLVFLGAVFMCAVAAADDEPGDGTQLVLLGTAGGPSEKKSRAQPANAVVVNGDIYIVDAGDGVVRQLTLAGFSAKNVRAVFITHNHSDHVSDYGNLLLRSWMSGRRETIHTYGPKPLERMTSDYLQYMRWDIELRIADEGRIPLKGLLDPHDIVADGEIYSDENVKVTVFSVTHGASKPAYGYRFDTAERSIVFSGDTSANENVLNAAKGADILVHEVLNTESVDALVERYSPGNEALKRHIINNHTSTEEVGEIATKANVKTLVLSHFGGAGDPVFDKPEVWEAAVRKTFAGQIIVGQDLMIID